MICRIEPNRNVRYGFLDRRFPVNAAERIETSGEPTPRQGEVLDAVLALLVEGGDALTMNAVARRASCST